MSDGISTELKQFIEHHIESVPQLEALLMLRNEPEREWESADISKALYIPEDVAGTLLADFVRRGFAILKPPGKSKVVYRPRDQDYLRLVDELHVAYHDRRVAIISLIYSKPLNKVQTFADAFKFGKENP
jgi:hypothetical protein